MAVFTTVSHSDAQHLFDALHLGAVHGLQGAAGGIENTNYFVSCASGEFVLTVFERLGYSQLPFYLELMRHLAGKGIPVPNPRANVRGEILHTLMGKPAVVVNRLPGRSQMQPNTVHVQAVADALARMHLASSDFALHQENVRGAPWWNATIPQVVQHLDSHAAQLIQNELAAQNACAQTADYLALPRGVIHADLFRDNVMFVDSQLGGFFDFYFAGCDAFLLDVAICLNDWCIDWQSGAGDAVRAEAFLSAYTSVRPFTEAEGRLLLPMRRAAALRFWTSRLFDFYAPREASMLTPHDPRHFQRVLEQLPAHP